MPSLPDGLYDALVTHGLRARLDDPALAVDATALTADSAPEVLSRHVQRFVAALLSGVTGKEPERLARQVALTNHLVDALAALDAPVDADDRVLPERLLQILRRDAQRLGRGRIERPAIPLRSSDLIVNGPKDLRVGLELQRELASADRVDVLVSFVKWSGFVELRDALQAFADRHDGRPPLRVLTTTYLGATEVEALEALVGLGAEVRVSYDARRTRLHAKAWLFHRASGFSTGVVGSSNLSHTALRDGCEWNVRLSTVDNGPILRKFEATFAQYWDEPAFEPYDRGRFVEVVAGRRSAQRDALAAVVRLRPHPHQQEVLDALQAERDAGHRRNLVVAATGTGKTVIAALDYARLPGRPSLLFVVHRREILEKARATYRAALGDGSFGELLTGTDKPILGRHVFASVQSLNARRLAALAPDAYDVVVVDEFHRAAAPTWTAVLDHLEPTWLLGMTATPERTDGRPILPWFDGRVAAESRLWDALDRGLLAPFQYFGVHDGTDLSQIDFRAGRYDVASLERVYTADTHRAKHVLRALLERVRSPRHMRALGFCVSVAHAVYMARFFAGNGLPAVAITGTTPGAERRAGVRRLEAGELCALFTVDVFNEGIDIPSVDTVLFLRPTESATLFLQQLGRGLRLHEGKACLTVLDFIGRANRRFRFDHRYRALLGGGTRSETRRAVEHGFPRLPSGCSIQLEAEAREAVLANIRRSLSTWTALAADLDGDWDLATFLRRADVALEELYAVKRTFTALRHHRGFVDAAPDTAIARALPRLLHVDDTARLERWRRWARDGVAPDRDCPHQRMLFAALGQVRRPLAELDAFWHELAVSGPIRDELVQLLDVLDDRRRRPTFDLPSLPLRVHATYSRDEVLAALGELRKGKILRTQGGVYKCDRHRCDLLFVTLDKDAAEFTPTTLYNDYPLSPRRFHWESQGVTRAESPTGRRYRSPPPGWRILLFVRQARRDARRITQPYLFLGPVRCESATGERPIQIVWRLEREAPVGWFRRAKIAAG